MGTPRRLTVLDVIDSISCSEFLQTTCTKNSNAPFLKRYLLRDIKQQYFKGNVNYGESRDFYITYVVVRAQHIKLCYNHYYTFMNLLVLHSINLKSYVLKDLSRAFVMTQIGLIRKRQKRNWQPTVCISVQENNFQ